MTIDDHHAPGRCGIEAMTMVLTLMFFAFAVIAAELVVRVAPEILSQAFHEETLRASVEQVRGDLGESSKKVDTLTASLKSVRHELGRAKEAVADVERELMERSKVEPILVFSIGKSDQTVGTRVHRAPLTKTLRPDAEPYQSQIWRRPCFVEVAAFSRAQAIVEASLQFPAGGGYKISAFVESIEAPATDSAA
ncbi:MAG: hypothetical protein JO128_12265 [Alphaproteobacteria bacterium]|nr:hypothetical protein [Alphaproteobacteria bacterium]